MSDAPLLELAGISKRFGDVVALDSASLIVRRGTVHALLGENGAGKTTLMRVAYGMVHPDAGTIRMQGKLQSLGSPSQAIRVGLGMVHQHFTLVPSMTVAENLALGGTGRLRSAEMATRVSDVAGRTGFSFDPHARVNSLSVGAQQRVEIAKAMAQDPSVLILDEPTAVLTPLEVEDLLRWLRDFVLAGHSVVLITHKLHEALAVSDDVTVMRNGRVVLTTAAKNATIDALTTAMLGERLESSTAPLPRHREQLSRVLEALSVTVRDESGRAVLDQVSLSVNCGEIVGIAAIEGSGQHELLRALAGRLAISSGHIVAPDTIGYIPEDRHRDAVLLDRTLTENIALRGAGSRRGRVDWRTWRARTRSLMQSFDVRAPSTESVARSLSGGNQQKLVLARELDRAETGGAWAILADNATRGLDVRATAAVQLRLREAAANGAAVVLYSSDIDEVVALSTRVFVMRAGTLFEAPLDRDAIGRAMLGVA